MNEKPILFSGPMVRAILEGRKTQTRRVVKPAVPEDRVKDCTVSISKLPFGDVTWWPKCDYPVLMAGRRNPFGDPGDRLWVRETWGPCDGGVCYRASEEPAVCPDGGKWKPSIFLPRWASRITLEITDVRVERVQDITDEDAQSEGIFWTDYSRACGHFGAWQDVGSCPAPDESHPVRPGWYWRKTKSSMECLGSARFAFANLWDSINSKRGFGWYANPWVWVISFRRVK